MYLQHHSSALPLSLLVSPTRIRPFCTVFSITHSWFPLPLSLLYLTPPPPPLVSPPASLFRQTSLTSCLFQHSLVPLFLPIFTLSVQSSVSCTVLLLSHSPCPTSFFLLYLLLQHPFSVLHYLSLTSPTLYLLAVQSSQGSFSLSVLPSTSSSSSSVSSSIPFQSNIISPLHLSFLIFSLPSLLEHQLVYLPSNPLSALPNMSSSLIFSSITFQSYISHSLSFLALPSPLIPAFTHPVQSLASRTIYLLSHSLSLSPTSLLLYLASLFNQSLP